MTSLNTANPGPTTYPPQSLGGPEATARGEAIRDTVANPSADSAESGRQVEGVSGRLLLMRCAGAPFSGDWDLASPRFVALAEEWNGLLSELETRREELVDALFAAVPQAESKGQRGRILRLKRDVFNGRSLGAVAEDIPAVLRIQAEAYRELQQRESKIFDQARPQLLAELRQRLLKLWNTPRFRAACAHSSADLTADLQSHGLPAEPGFTNLDRGLYTFVERFRSKANPFHLFADLVLPGAAGLLVEGECEVVLDSVHLFDLEARALPLLDDSRSVWLALRPSVLRDGQRRFWVEVDGGYRWVAPAADDLTADLLNFLDPAVTGASKPAPLGRRQEWMQRAVALQRSASEGELSEAKAEIEARGTLDRALAEGWVTSHWIQDFLQPQDSLQEALADGGHFASSEVAAEARRWCRHHLEWWDEAEVAAAESEIAAEEGRCFVNRYRRLPSTTVTQASTVAERVGEDLKVIKPFFLPFSNTSAISYGLAAYVADLLAHRGEATVPFLDVVPHFLRHRQQIIQRYRPESHRPAQETARRQQWLQSCAALEGERSLADLESLLHQAPSVPNAGLCFTGPYDVVDETFYPNSVFAGDGRFASRYALRRGATMSPPDASEDGVLDVELAVEPRPNLNLTRRRFAIGCGFEARYAHGYRSWIDVGRIHLESVDGGRGVGYRLGSDGPRLRIHYSGFLLAPYLAPELQLLLVGHGDFFTNPFQRSDAAPADGAVSHHRELKVGSLCLRRESWSFGPEALAEIPEEEEPLRFAAGLRRWFRRWVGHDESRWYYRAPAVSRRRSHKPRFLELSNPLSAHALRRTLAALPAGHALHCSAMAPSPEHLLTLEGQGYTTEWMIEV